MNTYPEEHPEEGLEIVHEAVWIAIKGTDGHEDFGAGLSWSSRGLQPQNHSRSRRFRLHRGERFQAIRRDGGFRPY